MWSVWDLFHLTKTQIHSGTGRRVVLTVQDFVKEQTDELFMGLFKGLKLKLLD